MEKEQKQLAITAVLIVVLIVSVLGSLKKKPSRQAAPAKDAAPAAPAAPSPVAPAAGLKPSDELSQQLDRLTVPWGRDPFTFGLDKGFQISELQLKGISFSKERGGYAFINDEIVKKGDTIGEYEVIEIEKDRVFLKRGNQSFYLTFPQE